MASDDLPESISGLFWDHSPGSISWEKDREYVIDRVLSHGTWDAIQWVRREAGDEAVKAVIYRTRARRLSPRQIRFWQVVFDLPEADVSAWLAAEGRVTWDQRTA